MAYIVKRDFSSKIQNIRIRIVCNNNKLVISTECSLNGVCTSLLAIFTRLSWKRTKYKCITNTTDTN